MYDEAKSMFIIQFYSWQKLNFNVFIFLSIGDNSISFLAFNLAIAD